MQAYLDNSNHCLIALALFFIAALPASLRQAPSKNFTVIYGSGGGFTGMANGYIIHSDGNVEKWSGLYFRRSNVEQLGAVTPKTLEPLQKVFAKRVYKKWKLRDTGNMTTRVWFISGKDTATVSWKGLEPDEKVPPAIRDFYVTLKNVVQSIKKP